MVALRRSCRCESAVYNAVGHAFNINSPQQLGDILFGELKLPTLVARGLVTDRCVDP
jgi:DNA polymerase I-like protein with 3'-5' exonuclease and polymerase domains